MLSYLTSLCNAIITDNYAKSDRKRIEQIKETNVINLNSNSFDFFSYTYDEGFANLEYIVSKQSNIYNPNMTILKFYQTLKRITDEYKAKIKAINKNSK